MRRAKGPWSNAGHHPGGRGRPRPVRLSIETLEERSSPTTLIEPLDGTGNNVLHPSWGSAGTDLLRVAPAAYADGVSAPSGADRPDARVISDAVAAHPDGDLKNDRQMSAFIYAWGQFVDHDMDLTGAASPAEPFNIAVPAGDPFFDPNGTGTQVIPLGRSQFDPATGTSPANPRQQVNSITAFIDGSMVYGSDPARAAALRSFQGGQLRTSGGNLLPFNTAGLPNANDAHIVPDAQLFLAGDVRANENSELTALQTLFVREHNRLASQIAAQNPAWNDERVFQKARAVVIGEIQSITYNEFLPALLGPSALAPYRGYDPNVNPGIATEFSTAAFRVGHTMLGNDVEFLDNNGNPVRPAVSLNDTFFNPGIVEQTGIDPILKYLASDRAEEVDTRVVDSVRNFLFGPPGAGGLDLASLNIQRGRDHGLADYNTVRQAYGLPAVHGFGDITSDPALRRQLQQLYGDVNHIDLWVGGLAEDHVPGASVGPTFRRIIADQFRRLRDGDRFWYQRQFSGAELDRIEHTTLANVIHRNTGVTNLQANVFFFRTAITGHVFLDRNGNGRRERNEPGVAGRTVQLLDGTGAVVATTTTGADGSYSFSNLDLGTYTVREVLPSGVAATTPVNLEEQLTHGMTLDDVNFGDAFTPTRPPQPGPGACANPQGGGSSAPIGGSSSAMPSSAGGAAQSVWSPSLLGAFFAELVRLQPGRH